MAIMVNKMMGNYQLDMALAEACDSDVVDHCSIEKNTRVEGTLEDDHVCMYILYIPELEVSWPSAILRFGQFARTNLLHIFNWKPIIVYKMFLLY